MGLNEGGKEEDRDGQPAVQPSWASRPSISAAACQSPRVCALAIPARSMAAGLVSLARLEVGLSELLIGRDLVVGMVGDQGEQPASPLRDIPLAQALQRQAVAEERVARILGEALFQLQAAR